MYRQPARPKPAHERQARAHGDDENVCARVGLAGHRNLAVARGPHEGIQQLARAFGRLILVSTQQTAAARTLRCSAHTHRAHVRREGHLDEQEYDENHEALDEDRGDDLGAAFVAVKCPQRSPSHG